jgi:hypothetical protein
MQNYWIWINLVMIGAELPSAHNGGSARIIKSSSRRWSTRPLPTSQARPYIYALPLLARTPASAAYRASSSKM